MNTIGIHFGGASTVIALCDGGWPDGYWRVIGDGMRLRIPNAVTSGGVWGSAAVAGGAMVSMDADELLEHPHARLFWQGLAGRVTSFLGRVEPRSQNGYEVVIALQTAGFASARATVEGFCRRGAIAALDGARCIPATRALLYRWMFDRAGGMDRRLSALVIAAGDTITSVAAYQVAAEDETRMHIVAAGRPWHIQGTGSAWWEGLIAEQIAERANMEIPPGRALEVRDGIVAMATRLRLGGVDSTVRWTGPLSESMVHPFEVNRRLTDRWKEVNTLKLYLPQALRGVVREAGCRPDVIVIGGCGACWPFITEILASIPEFAAVPVWQSSHATEDMARGAAVEPMFRAAGPAAGLADEDAGESRMHAAASFGRETENATPAAETARQGQSSSVLTRWTNKVTPPLDEEL